MAQGIDGFSNVSAGQASTFTSRVNRYRVWRKRLGVEPSPPAISGERPILKTGRATGPRSLPCGGQA
jgi:hypothetical protein